MLQRQNINSQTNSRFTPASNLKIGTYVLIPNSTTQKKISKKLQPLRKLPYQIIDKPTDETYNLKDLNRKVFQHRNNLLPCYPKKYALRELTQLYSFTGLKVVQNNSDHEQNQRANMNPIQKPSDIIEGEFPRETSKSVDNKKKITQTERKNRNSEEKILPQEQNEKSPHRQPSRFKISQAKMTKLSSHNPKY